MARVQIEPHQTREHWEVDTGGRHEFRLAAIPVQLRFTEIRGLYRPGHDDGTRGAEGHRIACGYQPGYASEDDRGRIFVNHRPRHSADVRWEHVRERDVQYIELFVEVQPQRPGQTLPAGLRLQWTWEDPDDPADIPMRADAAAEIDPNDTAGPTGGDNRGECDHPSAGASNHPTWEDLEHPMTAGATAAECETEVTDGRSSVRLHCTNAGGDNLRVRVRLAPHATVTQQGECATGIMTMWKRIDVEYRHMERTPPLPVARAARVFETCCVQMDFTEPLPAPWRDHLTTGPNIHQVSADYVRSTLAGGQFEHEGEPGWFFLASAHQVTSMTSTNPFHEVWSGQGRLRVVHNPPSPPREVITVPWMPTNDRPSAVNLIVAGGGSEQRNYFGVRRWYSNWPHPGWSGLILEGLDYQSEFVPGDGSERAAYHRTTSYFPRYRWQVQDRRWEHGGMGFPNQVQVQVGAGFNLLLAGISPDVMHGGQTYFAGRTIVYTKMFETRPGEYDENSMLHTIVHELGHAFGFPHKCGYYDWQDPATRSCCMNYDSTFVYAPGTRDVQPFVRGQQGHQFCPRHLDGIRRVHLEDNPAMWQW